ncbi:hypothetical protein LSTR_LSTR008486 [Laodelphax striatellus]|uniref:Uncharacterized protein n=1 Tax=Laodelphax striatellus TaxID=195883 RepID=A0A482WRL3_LAOST|nr:hypothetical protein LSTR_LSTR008486 [Laodelphax striatellus]
MAAMLLPSEINEMKRVRFNWTWQRSLLYVNCDMLHAPAQPSTVENSSGVKFRSQARKLQTTVFASQQLFHAPPLNFKYNWNNFPVEVNIGSSISCDPAARTTSRPGVPALEHTAFAF